MRFKLTAGWLKVRHANHCTKTICERIKLTGGFTWSTYYVVALIIYLISVILELYNSHKFSYLLLGSRQGSSPPFELSFIDSKLVIKLPWLDSSIPCNKRCKDLIIFTRFNKLWNVGYKALLTLTRIHHIIYKTELCDTWGGDKVWEISKVYSCPRYISTL